MSSFEAKRTAELKKALNFLYEASKILVSSHETKKSLSDILNLMSYYLNMHRGMVLLKDKLSDELYIAVSHGIDKDIQESIRYKIGEGIVGRSFQSKQAIVVFDIKEEPLFTNKSNRKSSDENLSFYAIPIKLRDEIIGVLAVDKRKEDVVSYGEDVDILKMISLLIAEFVKNMETIEDEKKLIEEEKSYFAKDAKKKYSFEGLIGISSKMKHVFDMIKLVSNTRSTVLIRGESGTGKEVVAKTIHYNSDRANKPFVAVNCAAIPKDLLEAELFGYEKGAFTGAVAEKKGKFELANGGTLFLDEIGDLPLEMQVKLLRVLQEKTIERIGGTKSIEIDVRIIAATNRDLEDMVRKKDFRLDLYYRLNVVSIFLPPLKERREDIPLIANHVLSNLNTLYSRNVKFDVSTMEVLLNCSWPGNVRELENCIERSFVFTSGNYIYKDALSCMRGDICYSHLLENNLKQNEVFIPKQEIYQKFKNTDAEVNTADNIHRTRQEDVVDQTEKGRIIAALEKAGWVQAKAARLLGMTVRQLNYRIQKYNIEIKNL